MEAIHSWITTIVAAVLITSFLEMLLPESGLQKFVRVVLGIFIVVTILSPIINLVHQNFNFEHVALKASGQGMDSIEEILAKGKDLKQVTGDMADGQYAEGLNKQVRALALLVNGVADAQAQVRLGSKKEGGANGKIVKVKVMIKTEGIFMEEENKVVKPVQVKVSSENTEEVNQKEKDKSTREENRLEKAVQETVANFYNLPYEQVEVNILD